MGKGRDGPVELAYAVVTVERAEHASGSAFGISGFNRRRWMMPGVSGSRK